MPVGNDSPRPLAPSDFLILLFVLTVLVLFRVGVLLPVLHPDLDDGERGPAQRVVGGLVRGAQVERVPAKSIIQSAINRPLMNGGDRQAIKQLGCKLHPNILLHEGGSL